MARIRRRRWQTPSGEQRESWICDYIDQAGKRHIKTFETRKAADIWLVGARHEVQQGTHTAASASITGAEAFQQWIAAG